MGSNIISEFIFWGIWLIIPLLIDILSGLISAGMLIRAGMKKKKERKLDYYPHITILVPVYNSEGTLENCIKSIVNQTYPIKNIQVFLIDNGSRDNSYEIYCKLQENYPMLRIWWLDSSQGKAKALNKGLYMADGKYIINIDSDGILDENAINNLAFKFENNDNIAAMTGIVLTSPEDIKNTKRLFKKQIQKCEFYEYCEAFMIGRGFQSKTNTIFTLAGAFSAFRKDSVLKTQLYNGETLGEDTHMTSQIREFVDGKIELCDDAFFYVDPIENLDKLYIQRQRWQRGEIEVSSLFWDRNKRKGVFNILNFTMLKDHTLVFPRLIWFFAMIYLIFIEYPMKLVIGANIVMYLAYVVNSSIFFLVSRMYLKEQIETRKFLNRNFYIILLLPIYRILLFFMRTAGIINSISKNANWNTKTFSEEKGIVSKEVKQRMSLYFKLKRWINNEQ